MTLTILYLWTIVGFAAPGRVDVVREDWRPMGEYASYAHCVDAVNALGLIGRKTQCISTGKPATIAKKAAK